MIILRQANVSAYFHSRRRMKTHASSECSSDLGRVFTPSDERVSFRGWRDYTSLVLRILSQSAGHINGRFKAHVTLVDYSKESKLTNSRSQ